MPTPCKPFCKKLLVLLMMNCLTSMPGCSTRPQPQAQALPPLALFDDCPPPPLNEQVLPLIKKAGQSNEALRQAGAEFVRYVQSVTAAFDECNGRMRAGRAFIATVGNAQ